MNRLKVSASLVGICFGLSACEGPSPVLLGTNTYFYGYIATGEKHGVSVGESIETASASLMKREYESTGIVDCHDGMARLWRSIDCKAGTNIEIFQRHVGLGHEWVYLEIEGNTVAKIGWESVLFQIDF